MSRRTTANTPMTQSLFSNLTPALRKAMLWDAIRGLLDSAVRADGRSGAILAQDKNTQKLMVIAFWRTPEGVWVAEKIGECETMSSESLPKLQLKPDEVVVISWEKKFPLPEGARVPRYVKKE